MIFNYIVNIYYKLNGLGSLQNCVPDTKKALF